MRDSRTLTGRCRRFFLASRRSRSTSEPGIATWPVREVSRAAMSRSAPVRTSFSSSSQNSFTQRWKAPGRAGPICRMRLRGWCRTGRRFGWLGAKPARMPVGEPERRSCRDPGSSATHVEHDRRGRAPRAAVSADRFGRPLRGDGWRRRERCARGRSTRRGLGRTRRAASAILGGGRVGRARHRGRARAGRARLRRHRSEASRSRAVQPARAAPRRRGPRISGWRGARRAHGEDPRESRFRPVRVPRARP